VTTYYFYDYFTHVVYFPLSAAYVYGVMTSVAPCLKVWQQINKEKCANAVQQQQAKPLPVWFVGSMKAETTEIATWRQSQCRVKLLILCSLDLYFPWFNARFYQSPPELPTKMSNFVWIDIHASYQILWLYVQISIHLLLVVILSTFNWKSGVKKNYFQL
jgi:hypothetical protein